jgi:hypothetical protein
MADNVSKSSMKGDVKDGGKKVADKAGVALEGAFSKLGGDVAAILKGLKDSLGIPDLPKIPKKPAFPELKKFEPKKAPTPKIYQKEEKKFEFGKAAPITTPTPKPTPPKGKLAYKYEWNGKRISVGFYEGDRYVDAVGALNFKGKVTEERAVELFIQSNKAEIPNLESWGMQKL